MLRTASLIALGLMVGIACGGSGSNSEFGSSGSSGDGTSSGSNASGSGGFGGSSGASSGASGGQQEADECKKMDIVFVIDNSGSMSQEQDNLALNFPKFIEVINNYKTKSGDQLDYRVAVTTTDDTKEKGAFVTKRGSGAPASCNPGPSEKTWFERADGDVAGFFGCRAELGTTGSNTERPLEAMKNAVTARIQDGQNTINGTSFVRDDALLAFVIITDEDEGGTENKPVKAAPSYVADFDGVKGDRAKWASAVIAGPTACSSQGLGSAAEARRLKEFIAAVGKNGIFSSICEGDLTKGLQDALAVFDAACKNFPGGVK